MVKQIDYPIENDWKIIFGDWCMATLRGIKVDYGKDVVIFVFNPDPFMMWSHQIQDEDFDQTLWVIKKEYPRKYCYCPNPDPKYQTWFLLCDYNGKKCEPAIRINEVLLVQNERLRAERDAFERSCRLIPLRLKRIIAHPEEFKKTLIEEMQEQSKAVNYNPLLPPPSGEK